MMSFAGFLFYLVVADEILDGFRLVGCVSSLNDVMMETLADNGNGNYAYVDDLDEARKLFVEDLTSTLQVIALDAKIQVDFNPDVVAYYVLTAGQA